MKRRALAITSSRSDTQLTPEQLQLALHDAAQRQGFPFLRTLFTTFITESSIISFDYPFAIVNRVTQIVKPLETLASYFLVTDMSTVDNWGIQLFQQSGTIQKSAVHYSPTSA